MLFLCSQMRKENDIADRGLVGEEHDQAVNAHTPAASGRHTVAQRADKVLVHLMGLLVPSLEGTNLSQESLSLVYGVIQLGEGIAYLHAADITLEALCRARIVGLFLGQGRDFDGIVNEESRLNELGPHIVF